MLLVFRFHLVVLWFYFVGLPYNSTFKEKPRTSNNLLVLFLLSPCCERNKKSGLGFSTEKSHLLAFMASFCFLGSTLVENTTTAVVDFFDVATIDGIVITQFGLSLTKATKPEERWVFFGGGGGKSHIFASHIFFSCSPEIRGRWSHFDEKNRGWNHQLGPRLGFWVRFRGRNWNTNTAVVIHLNSLASWFFRLGCYTKNTRILELE